MKPHLILGRLAAGLGRYSAGLFLALGLGLTHAQEASRTGLPSRKIPAPSTLWPKDGRQNTEILAFSWDGRLAFYTGKGPASLPGLDGEEWWSGWWASVLRPEAVTTDPDGLPNFDAAFSPAVLAAPDADAERRPGYPAWEDIKTLQHWHLSLAPDPGWKGLNPYPSDAAGNPSAPGPDVRHATYRIAAVGTLFGHTVTPEEVTHTMMRGRIGFRTLKIVVEQPETAAASIVLAEPLTPFVPFEWTPLDGPNKNLLGEEVTVTADGRLMFWKGRRRNNALSWDEEDGTAGGMTTGDQVQWSVNETPLGRTGWSRPLNLSELYRRRNVLIAGVPLQDRYPIAKERLRLPDGTELDSLKGKSPEEKWAWGAYPWVGQNGRILMYPLVRLGDPVNAKHARGPRRSALMVVGPLTNWVMRVIDSPINFDRETTHRVISASPGLAPGMWDMGAGNEAPIPASPHEPALPIWNAANQNQYHYDDSGTSGQPGDFTFYSEVSLEDGLDLDCVLSLHMNASIQIFNSIGSVHYEHDPRHTPDTTNRTPRNGTLVGDASFPQERHGLDAQCGRVGQAIYFGSTGHVDVAAHPELQPEEAFTVQLFVKLEVDVAGGLTLMRHGTRFELALEPGPVVVVRFRQANGEEQTLTTGPIANQQEGAGSWMHVAWTYAADGADGRAEARILLDGEIMAAETYPASALATDPGATLVIGPSGSGRADAPEVCRIDEVALYRVERTVLELRRAAYRPALALESAVQYPGSGADATATIGELLPLPLGLDAADLHMPMDNPWTQEKSSLGERLFFDPGLSGNGEVSCATCHDPVYSFTEPVATATGIHPMAFNAPTVINRAFSSKQFWNTRAATLEEQATMPVFRADEMGGTEGQVLDYLRSHSLYPRLFKDAQLTIDVVGLQRALASYQRSLLSGDSLFDRHEAGLTGPEEWTAELELGESIFFGRGNCFGCHTGPNFTDERVHNTGTSLSPDGDLGAFSFTGRALELGAFKTPTLRDVGLTAPHMHAGSLATLEDVVEFYDRGGHLEPLPESPDLPPAIQGRRDIELQPLGLSRADKQALVAFLRSLTGTSLQRTAPIFRAGE